MFSMDVFRLWGSYPPEEPWIYVIYSIYIYIYTMFFLFSIESHFRRRSRSLVRFANIIVMRRCNTSKKKIIVFSDDIAWDERKTFLFGFSIRHQNIIPPPSIIVCFRIGGPRQCTQNHCASNNNLNTVISRICRSLSCANVTIESSVNIQGRISYLGVLLK